MITIDDPETERLARELAARSGESVEAVVREAVRARATYVANTEASPTDEHLHGRHDGPLARTPEELAAVLGRVRAIQAEVARLPVLDPRSADDLLGYDEHGLPT